MKINIVVPSLAREKFSGGALCLLQYANGLAKKGHEVNVVPLTASECPEWFAKPWHFNFIHTQRNQLLKEAVQACALFPLKFIKNIVNGNTIRSTINKTLIRTTSGSICLALSQYSSFGASKGAGIDNLLKILPDADVTIATDSETAYAVALVNKGKGYYFSQHYEPFFWKERVGGLASRRESELSYMLGLRQIVNSPWLGKYLSDHGYSTAYKVCPNAIDHSIFNGKPNNRKDLKSISIISYGGRDADWKGFREMCIGMKIAKSRNPNINFQWKVYGPALLPPDNDICAYEDLGFLNSKQLAEAYRQCDVLLSASWYESFPLFPIEAMACGLATITTQPGTEDYAEDQQTALIVEAQNPESVALAIERYAKDEDFRLKIASNGNKKSREFTWDRSISNLTDILS